MTINSFINQLRTHLDSTSFANTMKVIEENYNFTPTAFKNGDVNNVAGTNLGSCKIFAFAKINNLSKEETLACFGDYYRVDVLQNPNGDDHSNIRNFIQYGWEGISFASVALTPK